MRIVSLLPSATEIVCALGARDALVGVSHECDFPADVVGLPVLTRARCRPLSASSGDIDRSVRDVVRDALAVYEIDAARLEALAPDVIVTQDLCDVCAVSLDDVQAAVARLARRDVRIVSLRPTRLGDVLDDVRRVGDAIGRAAAAHALVDALGERVASVRARTAGAAARPAVCTIEWIDPVMLGGLWMPELIDAAGGTPLGPVTGERAPTLDRAALGRLSPDVVLIKPCGFPLARTLDELPLLPRVLPWDAWPAVRAGRVAVADGNQYFNRPGPRLVDSLELLAAVVHPDRAAPLEPALRDAVRFVDADLRVRPWSH